MKKMTLITTLLLLTVACSKKLTVEITCSAGETLVGVTCVKRDFQLNKNPMAPGSNSSEKFQKTPDGTKIVYISDEDSAGKDELYVVDLEGGQKKKISPTLISTGDVISFVVAPNSQKVAFLADVNNDDRIDLYTVDLDGQNLAKVNASVPSVNHTVADTYKFMPNSLKLVFVTDELGAVSANDLFIANLDGSSRTKLNVNAPGNGVVNTKFEINSSGRIVYPSIATAGEWIMNSVLGDTTGYRQLSEQTGNPAETVQQDSFILTPNGLKVVYLTTADDSTKKELHSIDVDAVYPSTDVKISGVLVANGNVDGVALVPFQSTADSSKILFVADKDTDNKKELYSVGVTGTGLVKISGALPVNGDIKGFKVAQNSQDVVYLADQDNDEINEIYHVNLTAMVVTKVNSVLAGAEDVVDYEVSSTDGKIVYIHNKGGSFQVYSKNISAGVETSISGSSMVALYDVLSPKTSQMIIDNGRVFFRAALSDSSLDLMSANLDGSDLRRSHLKPHANDVLIAETSAGSNYIVVNQYVVYRVLQSGQKILYSSKY